MPCRRSGGSSSLHTYQSRYGEFRSRCAEGTRVLVGGVVHHQVEQHPDAPLPRLQHEFREVTEGAEPRMDAVVVGDVVAVVPQRRRVDRVQPDAGDAEPGQVVQPADQPAEVSAAVPVHRRRTHPPVASRGLLPCTSAPTRLPAYPRHAVSAHRKGSARLIVRCGVRLDKLLRRPVGGRSPIGRGTRFRSVPVRVRVPPAPLHSAGVCAGQELVPTAQRSTRPTCAPRCAHSPEGHLISATAAVPEGDVPGGGADVDRQRLLGLLGGVSLTASSSPPRKPVVTTDPGVRVDHALIGQRMARGSHSTHTGRRATPPRRWCVPRPLRRPAARGARGDEVPEGGHASRRIPSRRPCLRRSSYAAGSSAVRDPPHRQRAVPPARREPFPHQESR